ncbi:MAG: hypothetical protein IJY44_03035 [Bacteroidaceae bacterium]|nr:hypothetical protein [Bacteroidaceae bacterium]
MKKMMIIAALVSGMLMPAQIFAKENRGDKKPKAEYNKFEKNNKGNKKPQMNYKDFDKGKNNKKGYKDDYKYGKNKGNKKGYKNYGYKKPGKPKKPNVIVVNKPAPVPPPPPVKVVYKSNPVSAAASLVGLAALIAVNAD